MLTPRNHSSRTRRPILPGCMTAVSAIEPTSARNCQKSDDHRTSPIRWLDLISVTRMLPEISLKCLACSHQVACFPPQKSGTSGSRARQPRGDRYSLIFRLSSAFHSTNLINGCMLFPVHFDLLTTDELAAGLKWKKKVGLARPFSVLASGPYATASEIFAFGRERATAVRISVWEMRPITWRSASTMMTACVRPSVRTGSNPRAGSFAEALAASER